MTPALHRRRVLGALCGLLVGAGCTAAPHAGERATETAATTATEPTATETPAPDAGPSIGERAATRRAFAAERDRLETALSKPCVTEATVGVTVYAPSSTVLNRTDDAVVVRVRQPFGYTVNGSSAADGRSSAVYRVTAAETELVRAETTYDHVCA